MTCPGCGTPAAEQAKFCAECGIRLAQACPSCGTQTSPGAKFCAECGAALSTPTMAAVAAVDAQVPAQPTPPQAGAPTAERRLVSVLFADLVGFTTLSESRDAEEVRELLTRYFETCTTIIARYGGTVEKFIGDAVMAVWGAPVANEDDAERAVRAALDLVGAVAVLGEETGAVGLSARAGVLTGEAAVTIGATGQGLVAGDLVNTASRIQSAAPPGGVLVGEATRYASQAAIVFEDAGEHELKGKAEPLRLHRALRVVSMRSGGQRAAGLEAPFVGRTVELRTVRDLMHGTADRSTAHLVSITGIAGIGKSRLSWELEKYVDGLVEQFWWHRGRCLAYGEGVAFSALAEMVRSRALILENEDPESAGRKLATKVAEHVPDESERRWVEPRLRQLLALDEATSSSQEDMFAAWRLFFERMTATSPVVLVFEDMQWADSGLLDFVEYLLDWSRNHPLFIMTLARPELLERRPTWGASRRNVSSLYLEPLPDPAMHDLLAGLVPGLPDNVTRAVLDRAAGVPLYAVETVRMMLDRALLVEDGGDYRATGPLEELKVPETLHALVAARLDTLDPVARRLLGDAAVLGKVFTEEGLQTVSREEPSVVREALEGLLRREIIERTTDPRSPERGQLQFVQDLLQLVAYETLSRRDRRDKHLAVAAYLEGSGGSAGDTIEVVASHYVEALALMPDDDVAAELQAKTYRMLVRAGDRVAALAAWNDALTLFGKALTLAAGPGEAAEVHERAGLAAYSSADLVDARHHYEQAIADFTAAGRREAVARANVKLADVDVAERNLSEATRRLQEALAVLGSSQTHRSNVATLSAQLARTLYLAGRVEEATPFVEQALLSAEVLGDTETFSQALNTKSLILTGQGRNIEGRAILSLALDVALAGDHHVAALRAYNNLGTLLEEMQDWSAEEEICRQGLELARRVGNRLWEGILNFGRVSHLTLIGRWDEALTLVHGQVALGRVDMPIELAYAIPVLLARGDVTGAHAMAAAMGDTADEEYREVRAGKLIAIATLRRHEGDLVGAVENARAAIESLAGEHPALAEIGWVELMESEWAQGNYREVAVLLEQRAALPPGQRRPLGLGHQHRFEALLAAADGGEPTGFAAAVESFRDLGVPFPLAVTLLEHAEWLIAAGRSDEAQPLLQEAAEVFTRLKATPWLERLAQSRPHLASAAVQ